MRRSTSEHWCSRRARVRGPLHLVALLSMHAAWHARPLLGQQMQWVPRAELATLDFPPADAELIDCDNTQTCDARVAIVPSL